MNVLTLTEQYIDISMFSILYGFADEVGMGLR